MPWVYHQRAGRLIAPDGTVYEGDDVYSGQPPYRNDPAAEGIRFQGPIPRGSYTIDLNPVNSQNTGAHVLRLTPRGHNAHNRTDLQVHGENARRPGLASSGCVVAPRNAREHMVRAGDETLEVRE